MTPKLPEHIAKQRDEMAEKLAEYRGWTVGEGIYKEGFNKAWELAQEEIKSLKQEDERNQARLIRQSEQWAKEVEKLKRENGVLREGLSHYADGSHFEYCGDDEYAPETPSGEPLNILCGGAEGAEFQYEDGTMAHQVLARAERIRKGACE